MPYLSNIPWLQASSSTWANERCRDSPGHLRIHLKPLGLVAVDQQPFQVASLWGWWKQLAGSESWFQPNTPRWTVMPGRWNILRRMRKVSASQAWQPGSLLRARQACIRGRLKEGGGLRMREGLWGAFPICNSAKGCTAMGCYDHNLQELSN